MKIKNLTKLLTMALKDYMRIVKQTIHTKSEETDQLKNS